MGTTCQVCEANVSENSHAIECTKCRGWVHKKCTGLGNLEYTKTVDTIKKKGITWTCSTCAKSKVNSPSVERRKDFTIADVMDKLDIIKDIKEKLDNMYDKYTELMKKYENQIKTNQELRTEIDELKNQVTNLVSGKLIPAKDSSSLKTIREIQEMETRKKNLMVFGCPEHEMDEANNDNKIIAEIIQEACPSVNISEMKVSRVGRPNPNKIRPIRVKMSTSQEVRNVFFKARTIIKNKKFQHLAIGLDKSSQELAEYRALRDELNGRMEKGEKNLKIKYIHDVPKIIQITMAEKN